MNAASGSIAFCPVSDVGFARVHTDSRKRSTAHRCGGCEESAMTTANEKGSRDTGSDLPSGGSADRPSGTYEGDESMPQGI